MSSCSICGEAIDSKAHLWGKESLCGTCALLFRWFLGYYSDVDLSKWEGFGTRTTFHELGVESLDYIDWLLEAEQRFGVIIPNEEAQKMRTVGEYLRYIRLQSDKGVVAQSLMNQEFLWDTELDGRGGG